MLRPVLCVLACCLPALAFGAGTQDVASIDPVPVCANCRVGLEPVAVLGDAADGSAMICPRVSLGAAAGRFFLAPVCDEGSVMIYAEDSSYVGAFGVRGQGPGELGRIRRLWSGLESVVIRDDRFSLMNGAGDITRQFATPIPVPYDVEVLSEKQLLVSGRGPASDSAASALAHLVDESGRVVTSFATVDDAQPIRQPGQLLRAVATDRGGKLWTAHFDRVRAERWSASGQREAVFELTPDWWLETPEDASNDAAWVMDLRIDDEGLVWILAAVAQTPPVAGAQTFSELFDSVLLIIDPEHAITVASQRFDRAVAGWVHDLVYSVEETEAGGLEVHIWRPTLSDHHD